MNKDGGRRVSVDGGRRMSKDGRRKVDMDLVWTWFNEPKSGPGVVSLGLVW